MKVRRLLPTSNFIHRLRKQSSRAGCRRISLLCFGVLVSVFCISGFSPTAVLRDLSQDDELTPVPVSGCRMPAVAQNKTILWSPPKDVAQRKYILLHCFIGQMSNRKLCIINHMVVAGLLNRTLVVPNSLTYSPDVPKYDLQAEWDLSHVQTCLGPSTVITLDQYFREQASFFLRDSQAHSQDLKRMFEPAWQDLTPTPTGTGAVGNSSTPAGSIDYSKARVPLDMIHCIHGPEGFCANGDGIPGVAVGCPLRRVNTSQGGATVEMSKDRFLRAAMPEVPLNLESTAVATGCLGGGASVKQILEEFGDTKRAFHNDRTIIVGDLEAMQFGDPDYGLLNPGDFNGYFWLPLAGLDPFRRSERCRSYGLVLPPQPILRQARFLARSMFRGKPFLAVHWRRGDFKEYCPKEYYPHCYKPPKEVAECLSVLMRRKRLSRIYVATNGDKNETAELHHFMRRRMGWFLDFRTAGEDDLSWLETGALPGVDVAEQGPTIRTVLEKAVVAHGSLFLGNEISTFSMDIYRMRVGLGRSTTCDTTPGHVCRPLTNKERFLDALGLLSLAS